MINLLPPQEKQELLQDEKYRLILILGITFVLFLICLFLILLSLEIYLNAQVALQRILVQDEEEQFTSSQAQELETEINSINEKLLGLNAFYKNQTDLTEILEKVSAALPKNAYLTMFSLSPVAKEENSFQVSLTGVAANRETLFEFKKKLEQELSFKEVYFPPLSWVNPTDFSATFKLGI